MRKLGAESVVVVDARTKQMPLNIVGCIINRITIDYFSIFAMEWTNTCNLFYDLFKVLLGKVIAIC